MGGEGRKKKGEDEERGGGEGGEALMLMMIWGLHLTPANGTCLSKCQLAIT